MEEHFVKDGYTENGLYWNMQGEKLPLLMIHGIISDGSFFRESAEILSRDYRVITYDRRGYGKSWEKAYSDFSVSRQAEDAAQVLWAAGGKPAWILGNSAGGLIALELAMTVPELVKGLVLIEPSLGYEEAEREKLRAWNEELNGYVRSGRTKRALPAFSRVMGTPVGQSGGISMKELQNTYRNLDNFLYGELNEIQNYFPDIERLKKLKIPIIAGVTEQGRDGIFATSTESAAKLLGWPVAVFSGYHNAAHDLPEEFCRTLSQVLAGYR